MHVGDSLCSNNYIYITLYYKATFHSSLKLYNVVKTTVGADIESDLISIKVIYTITTNQ